VKEILVILNSGFLFEVSFLIKDFIFWKFGEFLKIELNFILLFDEVLPFSSLRLMIVVNSSFANLAKYSSIALSKLN
jgi:hypothetical protein